MPTTATRLRSPAKADLAAAGLYYAETAGLEVAAAFLDAAVVELGSIGRHPDLGSPYCGDISGIPGLRSWPIPHYSYRWYYIAGNDRIDVIRLLHLRQDLETQLTKHTD